MTTDDISDLPMLPPRKPLSHKGDYGRALVIGGSVGMTGAVSLAGTAALRSGAGLVTVATPDVCVPTVAAYEPSYMTAALESDENGRLSEAALSSLSAMIELRTAVGCGPGLGRSDSVTECVLWLYQHVVQPAVFDADALFALASAADTTPRLGPRIVTPHRGEFERLIGRRPSTTSDWNVQAERYAKEHNAVVVLKGNRTLVTDGGRRYENLTGNPGMATGGTGDVLTGIITGLLCQGLAPYDAARLGVYLHGLAGDLAVAELGEVSFIASDLLRFLPVAFLQHVGR